MHRRHHLAIALGIPILVFALSILLLRTEPEVQASEPQSLPAQAVDVPDQFEDVLVTKVSDPIGLAWTPDGRMLVARKSGELRVVISGTVQSTPAIDLDNLGVLCTNGERGLQDVEVHPDFAQNKYVFLYYTYNKFNSCDEESSNTPLNRLSRFVLADNNTINPNTETVFFETAQLWTDHHNGGDIEFGVDGNIYVTTGDGGRAQEGWQNDPGYIMGKIIRITADGGIPVDNPYTGADSARCNVNGVPPNGSPEGTKCQEVLSMGYRNPFRFGMDPNSPTVRFFINDVGGNTWEEVNEGPVPMGDYGWNDREGPCKRNSTTDCSIPQGLIDPVHWYPHNGEGAAITGGAFVPAGIWPSEFDNAYFYARFVQGSIWYITPGASGCRTCATPTSNFVDTKFADSERVMTMVFGPYEDTQALYYVNQSNEIRRISYTGEANRSPVAVAVANPSSGHVPLNVQFDASGSSDPDVDTLTYEWDLDGDGTPDSTDIAPSRIYTDVGIYTVTLTVDDGRGASNSTTIFVDAGNTPPEPIMNVPGITDTYAAGQSIILSGSAFDLQDGDLDDQSLTWEVRQHHNTHYHPYLDPTAGNNIEIITPGPEDLLAATNSYLEIILTATDSNGLQKTISRDIQPRKVTLTFESVPTGRTIVIEDTEFELPTSIISWENYGLFVDAPQQEDSEGATWDWEAWSDGGDAAHVITVPTESTTYTVTFGSEDVPTTVTPVPTDATPTPVPSGTSTPATSTPATSTPVTSTPGPGTPTPGGSTPTPGATPTPTDDDPVGQSPGKIYLPILRQSE